MQRLAESRLSINSVNIGTVWVESVHAEPAFEPRLAVRVGLDLGESTNPDDRFPPIQDYRLTDLRMQLRWGSRSGPIIGTLVPADGARDLRSGEYRPSYQVTAAVPIPPAVLEQIETRRAGSRANLTLEFSASAMMGGQLHQLHVSPMEFRVSHEEWGEFLSRSGFGEIDVIEVRRVGPSSEPLGRAVAHTREARTRIQAGDLNGAVGRCRMALEAAASGLDGKPWDALKGIASDALGERVARELFKIVSAVKQLSGETFHDYGADTDFGRAEAKFIVRCTEDVVALLAAIRSHEQPD